MLSLLFTTISEAALLSQSVLKEHSLAQDPTTGRGNMPPELCQLVEGSVDSVFDAVLPHKAQGVCQGGCRLPALPASKAPPKHSAACLKQAELRVFSVLVGLSRTAAAATTDMDHQ